MKRTGSQGKAFGMLSKRGNGPKWSGERILRKKRRRVSRKGYTNKKKNFHNQPEKFL